MEAGTATKVDPPRPSFCEAYCARYGCTPGRFAAEIFRRSLSVFKWPLAGLLALWKPGFFEADHAAIRRLGETRGRAHFRAELNDLHYITQRDGGWCRRKLGLHVSLSRLERLHARLFAGSKD